MPTPDADTQGDRSVDWAVCTRWRQLRRKQGNGRPLLPPGANVVPAVMSGL
jgi:hypothetical protein